MVNLEVVPEWFTLLALPLLIDHSDGAPARLWPLGIDLVSLRGAIYAAIPWIEKLRFFAGAQNDTRSAGLNETAAIFRAR